MTQRAQHIDRLAARIRACRICVDEPTGRVLPHEPRPVVIMSKVARICICGQAPGTKVHQSGQPFTDPSGDRLRTWMGVDDATFYDPNRIAIVPMGFCFPGLDAKGGDMPPRPECASTWRQEVMAAMPQVELVLLVGGYAQKWHLRQDARRSLTETVAAWREIYDVEAAPRYLPMPHPSWRNNGWLKRNAWFESELLPVLRQEIQRLIQPAQTVRPLAD